jgi:molecular chaperone HscB
MNYFEFYDLPLSFSVDLSALKKKFYALSRKYHPDFHTDSDQEEKSNSLELSSLNNLAYKTLSEFDSRIKYVLEITGIISETEKQEMPMEFLMEMMEINEQILELEMEFDLDQYEKLKADITDITDQKMADVEPLLLKKLTPESDKYTLESVRNFYLERKYLLRIQENLQKLRKI